MSEAPQRKILVIEDNEDLQEIYKLWFDEAGYEVRISQDGEMGIRDIVDYVPDIVILDMMMPKNSGFDVLASLKANPSLNIPVVVVSNLAQPDYQQRALDAGADLYLVKSDWEPPQIVAKIAELLEA